MTVLKEILEWSQERPTWQRDALRRLVLNGDVSDVDIQAVTEICKAAHGLAEQQSVTPLDADHIPDITAGAPVSLVSIFHYRGVNALAEDQTLMFGPNLTVVYGDNAAGKTGYIRILKSACRARGQEQILGNVVSDSTPFSPVVSIKYKVGAEADEREWAGNGQDEFISHVSVFDTQCAGVYLTEKTDVAFRPFGLDLFDKLVQVCKAVRAQLEREQRSLSVNRLVALQAEIPEGTAVARLLTTISSLTKSETIQELARVSPEENAKIIYKYPLKKAQEEGYFKPIRFVPVIAFNPAESDVKIAEKAVEQLRLDQKYNHILMARVESVERAREVFPLYQKYKEFNPVQLHTGIKSISEREEIRRKILNGESKIVVCVDMLGEGFDLPELKIAAFHDIRKSLAVTLQLAGRFTRARSDLGDPTFIANVAEVDVQDELRKLYTRDPDWNYLLPELSEGVIDAQASLKEFLDGFASFPEDIPLKRMRPATSTVIYKTKCEDWTPENFKQGIPGASLLERLHWDVNYAKKTLVIVTAKRVRLDWADIEEIYNWDWELYVVIWDDTQKLLFINNSSNEGEFKSLAKAVAGEDVELIKEQPVFRSFAGVNRLRLQNVGLTEQLGRLVRYTGRMGADVGEGLTEAQKRNARKAVLSGTGFEDGAKVTVGASRKGRIWSFRREHIEALMAWCKSIGRKVLDESIDPDEILKGTLESITVSDLPATVPIGIDWPERIYKEPEIAFSIVVDGSEWPLHHTEIALSDAQVEGELRFDIVSTESRVQMALSLFENEQTSDYCFSVVGGQGSLFLKHRSVLIPLGDFFYEDPPVIWFVDGSSLEGNTFTPLKTQYAPYDREKIAAWNWAGVDLRKESQGLAKAKDTIQYRVIDELKKGDYDVIFDDDGPGEAADVVAIKGVENSDGDREIEVEFYHCKYSKKDPGRRIEDMYEVCGQAQKSIRWMYSHEKQVELFSHLLRREPKKGKLRMASRFEKGDEDQLITIREMSRILPLRLRIFIVQPGLSKRNATVEQLELLSVTENHLMETYKLRFNVIANA